MASACARGYTTPVSRILSFSIFLVVSLAVVGGMHTYLWLRLVRDPAIPEPWRRVATVALVALAIAVPLGIIALRAAPQPLARVLPVAAFTWLGLAFMLFCALVAVDLVRAAAHGGELLADWLADAPIRRPIPPAASSSRARSPGRRARDRRRGRARVPHRDRSRRDQRRPGPPRAAPARALRPHDRADHRSPRRTHHRRARRAPGRGADERAAPRRRGDHRRSRRRQRPRPRPRDRRARAAALRATASTS